jgi:hypothetical protein
MLEVSRTGRFVIVLLVGSIFCSAAVAAAQSSGTFSRTGSMTTARSGHTATLLPNGKVLIAGGRQGAPETLLDSAELYDPAQGTFTATGHMTTGRVFHTATLLPDGMVLIAGGYVGERGTRPGTSGASAELYDPSTGSFTAIRDMVSPRLAHTAILLPNGSVVMVGGVGVVPWPEVAPAELYDPVSQTFTLAGAYVARGGCDFCAPAALLPDGTVLFPDQYPAQVYDPVTDSFRVSGSMIVDHSAATVLITGQVLFAGGESDETGRTAFAELYDAATGTFTSTGHMTWGRVWHSLTLLPNGTALSAGGETDGCSGGFCVFAGSTASAELYDPSTGTFVPTDNMAEAREVHTAILLNDGRVLMAGGVRYGGIGIFYGSVASAELYTPDVLVPAPVLRSIFHGRTFHVAGRDDPAAVGETLDIECTGLADDGVVPPQVAIGGRMAQVLGFGKAPGSPGLNRITVVVPDDVKSGPTVPVRLFYIGRPSNEITIAVQR